MIRNGRIHYDETKKMLWTTLHASQQKLVLGMEDLIPYNLTIAERYLGTAMSR